MRYGCCLVASLTPFPPREIGLLAENGISLPFARGALPRPSRCSHRSIRSPGGSENGRRHFPAIFLWIASPPRKVLGSCGVGARSTGKHRSPQTAPRLQGPNIGSNEPGRSPEVMLDAFRASLTWSVELSGSGLRSVTLSLFRAGAGASGVVLA